MLIEQQRLYSRATGRNPNAELLRASLQRLKTQNAENLLAPTCFKNRHAPEAANIRVPNFAPVVERKERMRVRRDISVRRASDNPPGHSQMNEQRPLVALSLRRIQIEH